MQMMWPNQVNTRFAEQDGLTPADFDYKRWPVSNVRIRHLEPGERYRYQALAYLCDISPDTPQANLYDADGKPIPDPQGICLSNVRFTLVDAGSYDILDTDNRDHDNGQVFGFLGRGAILWDRLKPGTSLDVRLQAVPMFMYIGADGGVHAEYALQNNGYFGGALVESDVHTLTITADGELLLDGKAQPPEPPPAPPVYTEEELRLQAEMDREHAEIERAHREHAAQMAKQQAEIDAAKMVIYGRRKSGQTDEDWLFGVLADKTLDFATVRKYVYLVAHEVGFEIEQARQRRQEKRNAEAVKRKAEYEREQDAAALADGMKLFTMFFDQQGATSLEDKAALLRKIYNDPTWNRYDEAAEAVAKELGVTL